MVTNKFSLNFFTPRAAPHEKIEHSFECKVTLRIVYNYANDKLKYTSVVLSPKLFLYFLMQNMSTLIQCKITHNLVYYMDSGILLGTKTLVELIRHYIRDTVRVFSVCHA